MTKEFQMYSYTKCLPRSYRHSQSLRSSKYSGNGLLKCRLTTTTPDVTSTTEYNKVTADDVQRVAKKYLTEGTRTVAYTQTPAEGGAK